jgi:hypothetical protein
MEVYIIAVFHSRSHTMKLLSELERKGLYASAVSTPRELSFSCGISAKFNERSMENVRTVIQNCNLTSFAGFYKIIETGGRRDIKSI